MTLTVTQVSAPWRPVTTVRVCLASGETSFPNLPSLRRKRECLIELDGTFIWPGQPFVVLAMDRRESQVEGTR
jgi:hypothetical protein